ncbi:unnamed protein product [Closterium sp. NIES-65]|nr:unnamed protein product [Closterium sp. NIES-65]
MASRVLVSVEGCQRAAPHSSEFRPTEAPLQTLHIDVWGPVRVRGQGHERYTTVFPLRRKGEVTEFATHQINLQPRVSNPETSPTLRWTGKVGNASAFSVWGSRAFVRDLSADKLSSRAVPCVFLGFPPDAPRWQFYHPTSHRVLSSQDVTFDELVPYYRVSQVDAVEPVEVAVDSGAARGAEPERAEPGCTGSGGAEPGGAGSEDAEPGVAESGGAEPEGAGPARVESGGAGPGAGGATGAGGSAVAGGLAAAGAAGGSGAMGPGGARTGGTGSVGPGGATPIRVASGAGAGGAAGASAAGGTGAGAAASSGGPAGAGGAGAGGAAGAGAPVGAGVGATGAASGAAGAGGAAGVGADAGVLVLSLLVPECPVAAPPASSLPALVDSGSDSLRAASPTVTRLLATVVSDPSFESTAASTLVAELVDFAAYCRLDYAVSLVAESESVCPPSVGGECALSTYVLEDRQEEFQCFAAALPHLVSMLLAPEGDPDVPDIPTPRSYAETIEGPYSSQWQSAMDAELDSWKSTGTYVDEVPPPGANIVNGMWIFRVRRPPGSPPVFKARYVARGFSQQQGVDYFQTFSPTPKMTTLRVLLYIAAQRDYELHSLDFSTAFLQGSLHEEIWLRRPPGFTGSFPPGT